VVRFNIGSSSESEGEHPDADECPFDGFASKEERDQRQLYDMLWVSLRTWTPEDLHAAERALCRVGIKSVDHMALALAIDLNRKLADAGLDPFPDSTVELLQRKFCKREGGASCVLLHPLPDSLDDDEGRAHQQRPLWDLLWTARPCWTPMELAGADRKLAQVGVRDLAALRASLAADSSLNQRLRDAGLKTFSPQALDALRRRLDEAFGCVGGGPGAEDAWMRAGDESPLRAALWACKPMWSAGEVASAEQKLARLGITSVARLRDAALAGDLNDRLKRAGLKTFNTQTLRELRRRLSKDGLDAHGDVSLPMPA